ncbi:MAG: DNA polymerase IV [Spirochaetes bacterium]|nr:DNA polymerase IV [Spirochaetota bacterium]MBN2769814.1 DNA polymerase IV [Spirochaetota bacterium]
MKRIIIHIDMDAFFAAVEQNDNPEFKGKPVVIGADPEGGKGRGVVSTASYEARKYGIRSAMPVSEAYRRCPDAIFIRGNMYRYKEVSDTIMSVFRSFSPVVEPLSLDEAFLDCSGSSKIFGSPVEIAQKIKNSIYQSTGLTSSAGISAVKSVAKIASDLRKPDGLTICQEGNEIEFLKDLSISRLWGVGKKSYKILTDMGFYKIGDISSRTRKDMELILGRSGAELWDLSRGIDFRPVASENERRKSISEEITFKEDKKSFDELTHTLKYICDSLSFSLCKEACKARTITLKLRYDSFETITRGKTVAECTRSYNVIFNTVLEIMGSCLVIGRRVRLIGVSLSNLEYGKYESQPDLFSLKESLIESPLDNVINDLKIKYGSKIKRASLLRHGRDNE